MAIDEDSTIFKNLSHALDVKRAQEQIDENKKNVDRTAYDVYDSEGKRIGGSYLKPGETLSKGDKVYVNESTGEVAKDILSSMTETYRKLSGSVTMSEDGKIKVDAPQLVLKNETFKNTWDDALKTISLNQKLAPEYKYALFKNSDETKTSAEWIEDINKSIQDSVKVAYSNEMDKYEVLRDDGVEINDAQLAMMRSNGLETDENGNVRTSNDYTAMALPKAIRELDVFKDMDGYDEEAGMAAVGNVKKSWDRGGLIFNRRETDGESWDELSWDEKLKRRITGNTIGNADSDADFLEVYNTVEEYFDAGDFSDTDEYVRMRAFRDFINKNAPDASFFYKANDVIGAITTGTVSGGAELLIKGGEVLSNFNAIAQTAFYGEPVSENSFVFDFLKPEFDNLKTDIQTNSGHLNRLAGAAYGGSEFLTELVCEIAIGDAVGKAAISLIPKGLAALGGAVEKGSTLVDSIIYNMAPAAESVSNVSNVISMSKANYLDDLMELSGEAGKIAGKYDDLTGMLESGSSLLGKSSRTAKAMNLAENVSAESRTIASVADILTIGTETATEAEQLASLSRVAASVTNAARTELMSMKKAERINKMIESAKTAAKLGRATGLLGGLISFTEVSAQATVDTMLTDPGLFREFIINADDESKSYIVEQIAFNYGAWAGFGALRKFAKSPLGIMLNTKLAYMNAAMSSKLGEVGEGVRNITHRTDDYLGKVTSQIEDLKKKVALFPNDNSLKRKLASLEKKQKALFSKRVSIKSKKGIIASKDEAIEAARKVAEEEGRYFGMVDEAKVAYRNLVTKTSDANSLVDFVWRQDISGKVSELARKYSGWAESRDGFLKTISGALEAEKKAGINANDAIKLGKNEIIERTLTKSSNDYINKTYRIMQADNYVNMAKRGDMYIDPNEVAKARAEAEALREWVKDFQAKTPDDLVGALDDVRNQAIKFSELTQDVRVSEKVRNAEALEDIRKSGFFDNGYLRQQRMPKDGAEFFRNNSLERKELRDMQSYRWGGSADDEYQDIVLTLMSDVDLTAKEIYRKEMLNILSDNGFRIEKTVSGEELSGIKESAATKNASRHEAEKVINNFVKDTNFENIFQKQIEFYEGGKKVISDATKDLAQQGKKVEKLKEGSLASSKYANDAFERRKFVRGLDDGQIDEILETYQDNPFFGDITDDVEFQMFVDDLDAQTKELLFNRISEATGKQVVEPSNVEKLLNEFVDQPKYNRASVENMLGRRIGEGRKDAYLNVFVSEDGTKMMTDLSELDNIEASWDKIKSDYKRAKIKDKFGEVTEEALGRSKNPTIKAISRDINSIMEGRSRGLVANYTLEDFQNANAAYGDLMADLKREWVLNSDLVKKGKDAYGNTYTLSDYISNMNRQQEVLESEKIYGILKRKLQNLMQTYNIEDITSDIHSMMNGSLNELVSNAAELKSLESALSGVTKNYDEAVEYTVMNKLARDADTRKKFVDRFGKSASDSFEKRLLSTGNYTRKEADDIANEFARTTKQWMDDLIEDRYLKSCNRMIEIGDDISGDGYRDYYAKIDALVKDIDDRKSAEYTLKTFGDSGLEEYVVVDPTVASIFKDVPPQLKQSGVIGGLQTMQKEFCKLFRAGTTGGLVPGSLVRQGFRDTLSSVIIGGATSNIGSTEKRLASLFGPQLADELSRIDPDLVDALKKSSDNVDDFYLKVVKAQEGIGMAGVESELEKNIYGYTNKVKRGSFIPPELENKSKLDGLSEATDRVLGIYEKPNEFRETYYRKRTYMNAMLEGMETYGMSVEEAKKYASFLRAEATTNFGRGVYHFRNLADAVPYFRSAINGSKSFWRLFAVNPVGISTRMTVGIVLPMIALTTASLSNEEDARIYNQIPEYEKDDNIVFVMNGQILSIPIPQELASLTRPIQTIVEKIHGGNDKSFGDLMLNNLAGFSPIELQGFLNVDANRLLSYDSPTEEFTDKHLLPGVTKMLAGMLDPLAKSAVMVTTKKDPFTGKDINMEYQDRDLETGELKYMDTDKSELAKFIARTTKGTVPAGLGEAILNNLFGKGATYIRDFVPGIMNEVIFPEDEDNKKTVGEATLSSLGKTIERAAKNATDPLMVERYGEQLNLDWNSEVRRLTKMKTELENSDEYKREVETFNNFYASDKAKDKAWGRIISMQEEYQKKVAAMVGTLNEKYPGSYDRSKFNATIRLMTFDNNAAMTTQRNAYAQYLSDEQGKLNRDAAIETMVKLGFSSTTDSSMMGYYKINEDGKAEIAYNTPLEILNFENNERMQDEIHLSAIRDIVKENDLYNRKQAVKKQIDAIYDKGNLSSSDYDQIDAIKIEWNSQVMAALAPYVEEMTPEAAINNKQVKSFLDSYIYVPGDWEVNDKGQYMSKAKLGSRGNKDDAYYDSWIKAMFGINDQYSGQN